MKDTEMPGDHARETQGKPSVSREWIRREGQPSKTETTTNFWTTRTLLQETPWEKSQSQQQPCHHRPSRDTRHRVLPGYGKMPMPPWAWHHWGPCRDSELSPHLAVTRYTESPCWVRKARLEAGNLITPHWYQAMLCYHDVEATQRERTRFSPSANQVELAEDSWRIWNPISAQQ